MINLYEWDSYKCPHCGEESSYQGHYFSLGPDPCENEMISIDKDGKVWGFRCGPEHRCLTSNKQKEKE